MGGCAGGCLFSIDVKQETLAAGDVCGIPARAESRAASAAELCILPP